MSELEFETGDLVKLKSGDKISEVVGIIHDKERLYLRAKGATGTEYWIAIESLFENWDKAVDTDEAVKDDLAPCGEINPECKPGYKVWDENSGGFFIREAEK